MTPKNWNKVTVGDLALRIHYGYTAKALRKETGVRLLRITDIQDLHVDWPKVPYCEIDESDIPQYQLVEGDLVFARTGATVGKSFLIKGRIPNSVFASYLIRIQLSKYIVPEYVYYFFQTLDYWEQISSSSKGVGQPSVNATSLSKIKLNLAPLKEQHRIVDAIEELFSDLDKGLESLKLAQQQLEIYRHALLKHAFEGKLTEQWRKNNNPELAERFLESIKVQRELKYKRELDEWRVAVELWEKKGKEGQKPRKPAALTNLPRLKPSDLSLLPSIPEGWKWVRNNELLYYVTSGSRDWKNYYSDEGAYFIRTQDIKTNQLVTDSLAFVDLPESVEGKRSLVEPGDLLMTITGANVGKVAIIPDELPEAYVSQSVALMKPVNSRITPFLHLYFQSDIYGGKVIRDLVYGVGRQVLSLENMREAPVAICSFEEQEEIVKELELQFSILSNTEETILHNINLCSSLRQSILKKAFDGKLVTQDPDTKSVSDLLRNIGNEKDRYQKNLKEQKMKAPKKLKQVNYDRSIHDILSTSKKPMPTVKVWQESKFKEDIEKFYAELKSIQDSVEVVKNGTESLLSLKK